MTFQNCRIDLVCFKKKKNFVWNEDSGEGAESIYWQQTLIQDHKKNTSYIISDTDVIENVPCGFKNHFLTNQNWKPPSPHFLGLV